MFEEEVKRILKMVEEGKLSPDEGAKLIEALENKSETRRKGKFLRIQVYSSDGDEINLKIPLRLLKFAKNFIPKRYHNISVGDEIELNLAELIEEVGDEVGDFLDMKTEDGDIVKISVE